MIQKNLPPDGPMPNLRTLGTGRWGNKIDLAWFPAKTTENTQQLDYCKMETVETGYRVVRGNSINNNSHLNNFSVCNFCTSSDCHNISCPNNNLSREVAVITRM